MNKLDTLNEMLRLIKSPVLGPDDMMLDELGYDAGLNGPNTTNCNFRLFDTEEHSRIWSEAISAVWQSERSYRKEPAMEIKRLKTERDMTRNLLAALLQRGDCSVNDFNELGEDLRKLNHEIAKREQGFAFAVSDAVHTKTEKR